MGLRRGSELTLRAATGVGSSARVSAKNGEGENLEAGSVGWLPGSLPLLLLSVVDSSLSPDWMVCPFARSRGRSELLSSVDDSGSGCGDSSREKSFVGVDKGPAVEEVCVFGCSGVSGRRVPLFSLGEGHFVFG